MFVGVTFSQGLGKITVLSCETVPVGSPPTGKPFLRYDVYSSNLSVTNLVKKLYPFMLFYNHQLGEAARIHASFSYLN